ARIVEARRGAIWLADGWRLFRAAPLGWLALVFAYWIIMTLASVVPIIGVAAASVMVPAFSVGFMAAARAASRRGPVELGLLFEGFRHHRNSQLVLGAIYFACLGLLLAATMLVDEGALASWMLTGKRPDEETLQSDDFLGALALAALLYAPVLMMFWFAPPLAAWHGIAPIKALFFSFFACLLNWRPFLAYGAVSALFALALPLLLLFVLMLASFKIAAMSLVFPLLLVLLPTLFASFYASYRDIFGGEPT
ncbi:MAG TPA: BPSS1780 family membrane protein, partial [Burkholderiales bacterium]|nr:BPSS1780 family membrane protein [Burkholderiales bacterium]